MLERGGRHGKFHSPLIALTGEQCVNQTAAEAVAATMPYSGKKGEESQESLS